MGVEVSSLMGRRQERWFLPALTQAVLVWMFNSKMRKGNSPAPCGSEPRYHGNLSLLAGVEILALHLLFWKDFVTVQCSGSSLLGLLAGFLHP